MRAIIMVLIIFLIWFAVAYLVNKLADCSESNDSEW